MKLSDASICHCRRGKARIEIDMQAYELTENTQILLLPGSIFNCTYASEDSVCPILFSPIPCSERSPHAWSLLSSSFWKSIRALSFPKSVSSLLSDWVLPWKTCIMTAITVSVFRYSRTSCRLYPGFLWQDPASVPPKEAERNESPGRDIQTFHSVDS